MSEVVDVAEELVLQLRIQDHWHGTVLVGGAWEGAYREADRGMCVQVQVRKVEQQHKMIFKAFFPSNL